MPTLQHKVCKTRIQKVHRLTQFIAKYVHHILSLFNIVLCLQLKCTWSGIAPKLIFHCKRIIDLAFSQPFAVQIKNWTLPNTWFLGPTQVHTPNGISIGSAIFAWLKTVTEQSTDRQADRPCYSVCKQGRIYTVVRCSPLISCAIL